MAVPLLTITVKDVSGPAGTGGVRRFRNALRALKQAGMIIPPEYWTRVDQYIAKMVQQNWDIDTTVHFKLSERAKESKRLEAEIGEEIQVTSGTSRPAKYVEEYGKRTGFFRDEVLGRDAEAVPIGSQAIIVKMLENSNLGTTLLWGVDLSQFVKAAGTSVGYPLATFKGADAAQIGEGPAMIRLSVSEAENALKMLFHQWFAPMVAQVFKSGVAA